MTPFKGRSKDLRARLIALGESFFRHRSWTPIPFILLITLCTLHRASPDLLTWIPGLFFLIAGETLRIWAVAVIGKESRTRGSGVAKPVTDGPYAYVRNPLYLGNLFLTLGAVFLSELLWFIPVMLVLFVAQYVPIVLWEERNLSEPFGAQYATYCQEVPRWFPRLRPRASRGTAYQWRVAWWSERSTLTTLAVLLLVMSAKENLHHLPKFLDKRGVQIPPVVQNLLKDF